MDNPDSTINTMRLAGYFPAGATKLDYSVADIPADRQRDLESIYGGVVS